MSSKPSSLLAPTHWAIVSAVSLVLLLILMIINVDHGIVRALMVIFGAVSTFSFFEFRAASRAESQADLMEQVTLAIQWRLCQKRVLAKVLDVCKQYQNHLVRHPELYV